MINHEYEREFWVEGYPVSGVVLFNFYPGQDAIIHREPENCQPGVDPQVEILEVKVAGELMPNLIVELIAKELEQEIYEHLMEEEI